MRIRGQARWMVLVLAAALVGSAGLVAAQDRESRLRTVRGSVVDKDENAVPSGVVYLKNLKTLSVKTYIADDRGAYRFSGLDPNVDYEIHAESKGMASDTKTISSLDSRKEIHVVLKLDKKK